MAVAVGLLLAVAPSAQATKTHLFKETFGSAAQPTTVRPGPVAIDPQTGDLFVVELGYEKEGVFHFGWIGRYKPNGEPDPFAALGTNTIDAAKGPGGKTCAEGEAASCDATPQNGFGAAGKENYFGSADQVQIAVDRSGAITDGDIYVTQAEKGRLVDVFAADGHYLGQLTRSGTSGPKFETPEGVAVDASGNVYVGDSSQSKIFVYEPTANPPSNGDFSKAIETVKRPEDLAVGTGPNAGSLFVAKHAGGVPEFAGGLFKLKLPGGELQCAILEGLLSNQSVSQGILAIAVDPTDGHLFVLRHNRTSSGSGAPDVLEEYDGSCGPPAPSPLSTSTSPGVTGVAANGEVYVPYDFREEVEKEGKKETVEGGRVAVLDAPIVTLPAASTNAAKPIGPTRATLKGTVNPDGVALSECKFEYGTTTAYGKTAPCEGAVPADSSDHAVQAKVTELLPSLDSSKVESSYHFRLVAANAGGTGHTVYGADQEFKTTNVVEACEKAKKEKEPPTCVSAIGESTATLNAEVDPDSAPVTECLFEYGTTTAYGNVVPCAESEAEIGSGEAFVPVHADLTGLTPATTYFWRARAATIGSGTGGAGVSVGPTFDTAAPTPVITEPASAIAATSATLNGSVDPGGEPVTECRFEYGATTEYGSIAPCAESEAEIGSGEAFVPVHAKVKGLSPAGVYHFRLIASPGSGEDLPFKTLGPRVGAEWAASVTTTEATLEAEINPEGKSTTYHLEYGTGGFEHETAESVPIGSGSTDVTVSTSLEGLEAGATYRYRFLATNADYSTAGPERTFNTYRPLAPNPACPNQALRSGPAAALPDCRAYELVSPAQKSGDAVTDGFAQATPGGEKLTYVSPFTAFGDPESSPAVSRYLAVRDPAAGWSQRSISVPRSTVGYYSLLKFWFEMYKAFSPDLCHAWVLGDTDLLLSPDAASGFPNLYRRDLCGEGGYRALTTTTAPPPDPAYAETDKYWPTLQGFSADGSLSVFNANAPLTVDAAPLTEKALKDAETQLYGAAQDGSLHLVSVLPDGSAAAGVFSSLGSSVAGEPETTQEDNVRHAVSADGSLVYWSTSSSQRNSPGPLYLRLNPTQPQSAIAAGECTEAATKACTLAVSAGLPHGAEARFQAAAADGSVTLFTAGSDLYEFDAAKAIAGEAGATSLIAKGVVGVMGTSEDANRVYFASQEDLGTGPNPLGESPAKGAPNLYLYERGGGFAFLGRLAAADPPQYGLEQRLSPLAVVPALHISRISPDGLHAAFTSHASLTGYDNTDGAAGRPDAEVYLYDAAASGEAKLICVSCNPSGTRPAGREVGGRFGSGGVTSIQAAALIPPWQNEQQPSRALAEDGKRLFFESYDALLPSDSNGARDVYEWEAPGEGDCDTEDANYFAANGGCLSLISSGRSPEDSEFADASADGRDVFFATESSLVGADPGLRDVYDARVDGGFPEPGPPAACEGEACQSPPEAPNDPTPGSSSFQGAGNVHKAPARCSKGKVRRKGRCVATRKGKAHKRHHQVHAKRRAHR